MHRLLFERFDEWLGLEDPNLVFMRWAVELEMNTVDFASCVINRKSFGEVYAAREFGRTLGVDGTPALFLNGELTTARSYGDLSEIIETALTGTNEALAEQSPGSRDPVSDSIPVRKKY
jgi:hypothetical protein